MCGRKSEESKYSAKCLHSKLPPMPSAEMRTAVATIWRLKSRGLTTRLEPECNCIEHLRRAALVSHLRHGSVDRAPPIRFLPPQCLFGRYAPPTWSEPSCISFYENRTATESELFLGSRRGKSSQAASTRRSMLTSLVPFRNPERRFGSQIAQLVRSEPSSSPVIKSV
jgi:hypothetical protein